MADPLALLALGGVAVEWLALGWLSGVGWPGGALWVARWGLRLLVGAWLVALSILLLALVGIGFGNVLVVLALAALLAGAVRVLGSDESLPYDRHVDTRELIGWLLLATILAAATLRALIVPEYGWDAYSHWGLKAQAYALSGTIVDTRSTHEYYPPLVPLLEAWLHMHRGAVSIDAAKTIWPLVGSAFGVCLAWHLRLTLGRVWLAPYAAAGIVLASTQLLESFWTGQADLALTAYLTLTTLAAFQWLRDRRRIWLVHVLLLGAATALTKYEAVPRLGVVVVALFLEAVLSRRASTARVGLALALGAFVGVLPWLLFRALHGFEATSEHLSGFRPLAIGGVLGATFVALAGVRTGGAVLIAVLAWLSAARMVFAPPLRFLSVCVVGHLALTLLAFLVSQTAPEVQAQTSATRLFEQFMPVALFVAAVALERRPIIAPWR